MLTLAAGCAVCFFLAAYLGRGGSAPAAAAAVPVALVLSLLLARLVHWYCRPESYGSLTAALTDFSSGGYALAGAFAGCALTALLLRLLGISRNLPLMLDCMSLAGAAGIAVGRLSSLFNSTCRGMLLPMAEFPWACAVENPVSGETEYRLATFLLQALAAGGIFLILTGFFVLRPKGRRPKDGDAALLFLLCYGASQVLLDSTRYDSLYLRSNGFVSLVQVLSAGAMVLAAAVFAVRLVRARGFRFWQVLLWAVFAACLGSAGYMEYYVQRHGSQAAFAYSLMAACLLGAVVTALVIRWLAVRAERRPEKPFYITTEEHPHG